MLPGGSEAKNAHTSLDTIANRASISRMLKSFAALFLLSASAVFAQSNPTAYDALRTMGNQLNRDYVNRVVSVIGLDRDIVGSGILHARSPLSSAFRERGATCALSYRPVEIRSIRSGVGLSCHTNTRQVSPFMDDDT